MIKFEKITPGMILYDVRRASGLATFRGDKWDVWYVNVLEVDTTNRKVFASWNTNKPRWMSEAEITRYRAKLPKGYE